MLYQREFQNNEEPAKHHISCFGYETEADRQYPTHCHAYYEISYLVSGERYQIINGQRYKVEPGSFFLFSPLCMHGYHNITECQDLVIHYIMANPAERLDMHEASRRCGLSYYAFSRFFHEMTGMGYAEYGNLIRIRHTEELLIYSDMSVEEISRAVGMSFANYYTRLFKKVNGMSPTKYRSVYGKRQY